MSQKYVTFIAQRCS